MQRLVLFLLITVACLLSTPIALADIKVAPAIGDNMVLQRNTSVPIWGTAAPNERLIVTFRQQRVEAVADDLGRWQARLGPLTASEVPVAMTIHGKNDSLVLNNILVGEVWLVSGQSNMEFPMVGFPVLGVHLSIPIQHRLQSDLAKEDCTNVRLFRMVLDGDKPTGRSDGWKMCDSTSMAPFSAVGFYFAQELSKELGVPIGILEAAVGGTRIEPWTPVQLHKDSADMGFLYTKLIKPLSPYALRGVLWYQGEANVIAPGVDTYSKKCGTLLKVGGRHGTKPIFPSNTHCWVR